MTDKMVDFSKESFENLIENIYKKLNAHKYIATTAKAWAYLSSDQLNLTNNTITTVVLDTEDYDPGKNFDISTNKFVVPVSGWYDIDGQVLWKTTSVVADKRYDALVYVNANLKIFSPNHSSLADSISCPFSGKPYLQANDEIYLKARQVSGVDTVDIWGGSAYATYISIHLISA